MLDLANTYLTPASFTTFLSSTTSSVIFYALVVPIGFAFGFAIFSLLEDALIPSTGRTRVFGSGSDPDAGAAISSLAGRAAYAYFNKPSRVNSRLISGKAHAAVNLAGGKGEKRGESPYIGRMGSYDAAVNERLSPPDRTGNENLNNEKA